MCFYSSLRLEHHVVKAVESVTSKSIALENLLRYVHNTCEEINMNISACYCLFLRFPAIRFLPLREESFGNNAKPCIFL